MSNINLSSNIKGAIDDMLQGSIAGNISLNGGSAAVIEPKIITSNGTYEAPEGVDGYNPITVNVPIPEPPTIENVFLVHNGTYEASAYGWDGFGKVEVEVVPYTIPITITENGTYTPTNVDGYNPVVVNVPLNNQKLSNFFTQYYEASMNLYYNINGFESRWNGGSSIACQLKCNFDLSNYSKIKVSLITGNSYYNTYGAHPVREIWIGIVDNVINLPYDPTGITYQEYFRFHDDNSYYNYEFDLTEINTLEKYLIMSITGWDIINMTIELM